MKSLAIIPARGGSKRIPKKNIKDFLGKPIIAYSIESALKSGLFSKVMVSTDDIEIKEIAIKYGAEVPFLRSAKNSDDFATTIDVIKEVISQYENMGEFFDTCCCIYSTAPFVTPISINSGFELLVNNNFDSVFSIAKFGFPIQRALKIESGKAQMFYPENLAIRSQDLEPSYHDAGQFYWMKINEVLRLNRIFTDNSGVIVYDENEVQDIDTLTDWKLAELKYKLLNRF